MKKYYNIKKPISKSYKNLNFNILKKFYTISVILLIVGVVTILWGLLVLSEILPTYRLASLDTKIALENFLITYKTNLENTLLVKKIEKSFYFSITSDRYYFLERLLIFIKKNTISIILQPIYLYDILQNIWINKNTLCEVTTIFEDILNTIIFISIFSLVFFLLIPVLNISIYTIFLPISIIITSIYILFKINLQMTSNDYISYINWLINESFINRNIYIDSNYFLTNDATKGIERFSDLVIPWLVDNEEMEVWGGTFKTQTQVSRIQERERHFIMNDYSNLLSPNLNNKNISDGTFFGMLEKPIRRATFLIDLLLNIAAEKEIIESAWETTQLRSESYSTWINPNIINNIWGPGTSNVVEITPSNFKTNKTNIDLISRIKIKKNNIKKITYDLGDDELDFILPQKNNILGDSIARVGNIRDRKQIVYRGAVNSLPDLPENKDISIRRPDFTKNTNYIFEKTLQNERSIEYGAREHLKKYLKNHFSKYWLSLPEQNKLFIKECATDENKQLNFKIDEYAKILNTKFINKEISKNINTVLSGDSFLNKIAKAWKLTDNYKQRQYTRKFEYNYNLFENMGIRTFEIENSWLETTIELLQNKKLGIGSYTYMNNITSPWNLNNNRLYTYWNDEIKQTVKNPVVANWGEFELKSFYTDLHYLLKNIGILNKNPKILINISKICLDSWLPVNYTKNNLHIVFFELLYKLNYIEIENNWQSNIKQTSKIIEKIKYFPQNKFKMHNLKKIEIVELERTNLRQYYIEKFNIVLGEFKYISILWKNLWNQIVNLFKPYISNINHLDQIHRQISIENPLGIWFKIFQKKKQKIVKKLIKDELIFFKNIEKYWYPFWKFDNKVLQIVWFRDKKNIEIKNIKFRENLLAYLETFEQFNIKVIFIKKLVQDNKLNILEIFFNLTDLTLVNFYQYLTICNKLYIKLRIFFKIVQDLINYNFFFINNINYLNSNSILYYPSWFIKILNLFYWNFNNYISIDLIYSNKLKKNKLTDKYTIFDYSNNIEILSIKQEKNIEINYNKWILNLSNYHIQYMKLFKNYINYIYKEFLNIIVEIYYNLNLKYWSVLKSINALILLEYKNKLLINNKIYNQVEKNKNNNLKREILVYLQKNNNFILNNKKLYIEKPKKNLKVNPLKLRLAIIRNLFIKELLNLKNDSKWVGYNIQKILKINKLNIEVKLNFKTLKIKKKIKKWAYLQEIVLESNNLKNKYINKNDIVRKSWIPKFQIQKKKENNIIFDFNLVRLFQNNLYLEKKNKFKYLRIMGLENKFIYKTKINWNIEKKKYIKNLKFKYKIKIFYKNINKYWEILKSNQKNKEKKNYYITQLIYKENLLSKQKQYKFLIKNNYINLENWNFNLNSILNIKKKFYNFSKFENYTQKLKIPNTNQLKIKIAKILEILKYNKLYFNINWDILIKNIITTLTLQNLYININNFLKIEQNFYTSWFTETKANVNINLKQLEDIKKNKTYQKNRILWLEILNTSKLNFNAQNSGDFLKREITKIEFLGEKFNNKSKTWYDGNLLEYFSLSGNSLTVNNLKNQPKAIKKLEEFNLKFNPIDLKQKQNSDKLPKYIFPTLQNKNNININYEENYKNTKQNLWTFNLKNKSLKIINKLISKNIPKTQKKKITILEVLENKFNFFNLKINIVVYIKKLFYNLILNNLSIKNNIIWKIQWEPIRNTIYKIIDNFQNTYEKILSNTRKFEIIEVLQVQQKTIKTKFKSWGAPKDIVENNKDLTTTSLGVVNKIIEFNVNKLVLNLEDFKILHPQSIIYLSTTGNRNNININLSFRNRQQILYKKLSWNFYKKIIYEKTWLLKENNLNIFKYSKIKLGVTIQNLNFTVNLKYIFNFEQKYYNTMVKFLLKIRKSLNIIELTILNNFKIIKNYYKVNLLKITKIWNNFIYKILNFNLNYLIKLSLNNTIYFKNLINLDSKVVVKIYKIISILKLDIKYNFLIYKIDKIFKELIFKIKYNILLQIKINIIILNNYLKVILLKLNFILPVIDNFVKILTIEIGTIFKLKINYIQIYLDRYRFFLKARIYKKKLFNQNIYYIYNNIIKKVNNRLEINKNIKNLLKQISILEKYDKIIINKKKLNNYKRKYNNISILNYFKIVEQILNDLFIKITNILKKLKEYWLNLYIINISIYYNLLILNLWVELYLIKFQGWLILHKYIWKMIKFLSNIFYFFENIVLIKIRIIFKYIYYLNFDRKLIYFKLLLNVWYLKIENFLFNINLQIQKKIRDWDKKNIIKIAPVLNISQNYNNFYLRITLWEWILKNLQIKFNGIILKKIQIIDYSEILFELKLQVIKQHIKHKISKDRLSLFLENTYIKILDPIYNLHVKHLNKQEQITYKINEFVESNFSNLETSSRYLHFIQGSIGLLYKKIFSGLDSFFENRGQLIWLNICIWFDFLFELATGIDSKLIESPLIEIYEDAFELFDDYFTGQEEGSDDWGLLGWTLDVEFGENPGNDFATINDIFELPADFEKWMRFDTVDMLHVITGLDSPELGELYPSFDITVPIKSLWLVGVFYYNPNTGGALMLDMEGLLSFIKILFIDRRVATFSNIYQILDFKLENVTPDIGIFIRLKVYYLLDDFGQILERVFINPLDFIDLLGYYIIFLSTYFGITTPILIFILLLYFGKINKYFEREMRQYSSNDFLILKVVSYTYNYFLYRFFYHILSNIFIFIRMTFATMLILTGIYVVTEGMHIFGVLRVLNNDQENTKYLGGLYFQLERDPFVEKHIPNDEIWDEFKYDSQISNEWSRMHFHRENSEILGGNQRESGTVIAATGFNKKFNFEDDFEHDEDGDDNTSNLREIIDQIHNRVVDESSFNLKFINDTELEREFFREFEMRGSGVEGSIGWLNRSKAAVEEAEHAKFTDDYIRGTLNLDMEVTEDNFQDTFYDLMLYNMYDPKWLYNETTLLSERESKPNVFNHSMQQMYNSIDINNPNMLLLQTEVIAKNRISGLISRNKGDINFNPILDIWDQDNITDFGILESSDHGTTFGSLGNLTDTWLDATAEPITQFIRNSTEPAITDTVAFNHATNDDILNIDFYKNEKIMLENSYDSLKRTRLPLLNSKPIQSFIGEDKDEFQNYDDYENYQKEENKGLLEKLDKNDINMLFLNDDDFEDGEDEDFYFDWLFWDLNDNSNIFSRFFDGLNILDESLKLKNIRRRDLFYTKMDGLDRPGIYKESILKENKKTDTMYKIYNTLNKYRIHNANAFFINNEHESKEYAFSSIITGDALEEIATQELVEQNQPTFQMFMNTNTENNNHDINPNEATDDITESMWGVFENYYDGGLKAGLNSEHIKFKDYKIKHYKKNRDGLYSYLVQKRQDSEKILKNNNLTNSLIKTTNGETKEEKLAQLDESLVSEKTNSNEKLQIINNELEIKNNLELDKESAKIELTKFIELINIPKNKILDSINKNSKLNKDLKNSNTDNISYENGLTKEGIIKILNRIRRGNINRGGKTIFPNLKTFIDQKQYNQENNLNNLGIPLNKKLIYNINTNLHNYSNKFLNANMEFLSKKNSKIIQKLIINDYRKFKPFLKKLESKGWDGKKRTQRILKSSYFNKKIIKESKNLSPNEVTIKYTNNSIINKLSQYIQKFNAENAYPNTIKPTTNERENTISDIIYNTILEDSWAFDNKFKLNFSRLVDQDYTNKIPRVINTLQDAWDFGESKELLSKLKKQKLGEFAESDSWDLLDNEDVEELENEQYMIDSYMNFATIDTGANPLINNPDENHWTYVLGKNQNFGSLRNSLEYLAKDVFLELKDLEEESISELGYTWREYDTENEDDDMDLSAYAPSSRDTYEELEESFAENIVDPYITQLWSGESIEELPGFNLINNYDDLGITLGKKVYKNMINHLNFKENMAWGDKINKIIKKTPWGFDFHPNFEWSGTQLWNLDSQFENFGNLFSEKKYKIWDIQSKKQTLDKISENNFKLKPTTGKDKKLKLEKIDTIPFLNNINEGNETPLGLQILPEKPNEFLNEKIENIDFIPKKINIEKLSKLILQEDSSKKSTIFDKIRYNIDKKIENLTQFAEYEYPDFSEGDDIWIIDSELNHNWGATVKQDSGINKLNFLQRSLKQKIIMQEYFSQNMQMNTQVSSFREANDLTWYLKKRKKRLKLNKILGNSPNSRITDTDKSSILYKNWDSKIEAPASNYSILYKNYDIFGYDKEDSAFESNAISNMWVSNRLSNLVENTKLDENVMESFDILFDPDKGDVSSYSKFIEKKSPIKYNKAYNKAHIQLKKNKHIDRNIEEVDGSKLDSVVEITSQGGNFLNKLKIGAEKIETKRPANNLYDFLEWNLLEDSGYADSESRIGVAAKLFERSVKKKNILNKKFSLVGGLGREYDFKTSLTLKPKIGSERMGEIIREIYLLEDIGDQKEINNDQIYRYEKKNINQKINNEWGYSNIAELNNNFTPKKVIFDNIYNNLLILDKKITKKNFEGLESDTALGWGDFIDIENLTYNLAEAQDVAILNAVIPKISPVGGLILQNKFNKTNWLPKNQLLEEIGKDPKKVKTFNSLPNIGSNELQDSDISITNSQRSLAANLEVKKNIFGNLSIENVKNFKFWGTILGEGELDVNRFVELPEDGDNLDINSSLSGITFDNTNIDSSTAIIGKNYTDLSDFDEIDEDNDESEITDLISELEFKSGTSEWHEFNLFNNQKVENSYNVFRSYGENSPNSPENKYIDILQYDTNFNENIVKNLKNNPEFNTNPEDYFNYPENNQIYYKYQILQKNKKKLQKMNKFPNIKKFIFQNLDNLDNLKKKLQIGKSDLYYLSHSNDYIKKLNTLDWNFKKIRPNLLTSLGWVEPVGILSKSIKIPKINTRNKLNKQIFKNYPEMVITSNIENNLNIKPKTLIGEKSLEKYNYSPNNQENIPIFLSDLALIKNTGTLSWNSGWDNIKLKLLEYNKVFPGIINTYDLKQNLINLDTKEKFEPIFGNSRFKDYIPNTWNFTTLGNVGSFGKPVRITQNSAFLEKYNLLREFNESFIPKIDNRHYIDKDIDGFFSDGNYPTDKLNNSYIKKIAMPVSFVLGKKNQNLKYLNDYILDYDLGKLVKQKNNINSNIELYTKYDKNRLRLRKRINNLLRNSAIRIRGRHKKRYRDGVHIFTASESIIPSPYIRSLSIESNLFSKINNLRIFGAGRLEDLIYRPKLKQLLKIGENLDREEEENSEFDEFVDNIMDSENFENEDLWGFDMDLDNMDSEEIEVLDTGNSIDSEVILPKTYQPKSKYLIDNIKQKKNWITLFDRENIEDGSEEYNDSINQYAFSDNDNILTLGNLGLTSEFKLDNNLDFKFELNIDEEENEDVNNILPTSRVVENFKNNLKLQLLYNSNSRVSEDTEDSILDLSNISNDLEEIGDIDMFFVGENNIDINKNENWNSEYFNDFEEFAKENIEYLDSLEDIETKDEWLFELYTDLIADREERIDIRERLTNSELEKLNSQITNSYKSNLQKRERDQELGEHVLHLLENSIASGNIYSTVGDISSEFQKLGMIFGEDNKNNITLDQEDLFDKLLFNLKEPGAGWDIDNEEDIFNSNEDEDNDFDIEETVLDQGNIIVPITPQIVFGFDGFENKWGNKDLSQEELDIRINNIGRNLIKKSPPNSNISTFEIKRDRTNLESIIFRNTEQKNNNWWLGRNDFDDELEKIDEFELSDDFNIDESIYSLGEISSLIKNKRIDNFQENSLNLKLSEYFINKINNLDDSTQINPKDQIINILTDNTTNNRITEANVLNSFEDSNSIWNLKYKNNKNFWEENKNPIILKQKTKAEKTIYPRFKRRFASFVENYNISKFTLGGITNGGRIRENISTLYRKGTSGERALKSRIKWKKLKKTYINRLDIVEKYINSLKNLKKIKLPIDNILKKNLKKQTVISKPIHTYLLKNKLITEGITEFRGLNLNKNILLKKLKIPKNKIMNTDSLEKTWEIKNKNIWNTIKNITTTIDSPSYRLYNNQLSEIDEFDGELDQIHENSEKSINYFNQKEIRSEYLNNNQEKINSEDFEDGFTSLEELLDLEEENLEVYSRVRNNMVKLMQSKKSDSILPTEVLSAFLAKLPNVDITSKLGEELKKPFKYSIDKKNTEDKLRGISNFNVIDKQRKKRKQNFTFGRLNAPTFNKKSRIIDEFNIHRKRLQRVGVPLKNKFYRFSVQPFNQFSNNETLLTRSLEYGMGNLVYKNNAINRRSDDLQQRTFGPEIRLNSTVYGYGRLDKSLDQNLNSEEDYGLLSGLGFPEVVEQNVFDETDWVEMAYGGTIYSSKFTDFIWMLDDDREEEEEEEEKEDRMDRLLFGDLDDDESKNQLGNLYKNIYLLGQIFNLNDYKKHYKLPAGYNRFFSTNNQYVYDLMQGNLQLTAEDSWTELLEQKDETDFKKVISESLQFDENGLDVSPLGFEEGESLYDSRLLNRGWFPEKILWDIGVRSAAKVGSDPNTLELLADYRKSFAHEAENFGKNPEREAFRSLHWAKNPVFDTIDDILEGIGIEEDIPYSPAHSEKLWHYFEYESRPNSEKLEETPAPDQLLEDLVEDEEEEIEFYGPDSDPTSIDGIKLGNFNLLGLNDFIVGSRVWNKTRYLGGLDQAEIPGVSLALADNELYDGLRTDFHNFLIEKLPADPLSGFHQTTLPLTIDGLFGGDDTPDSKIPEFSRYIMDNEDWTNEREDFIPNEESTEMDRKFYMYETFRPKDEFSFAPTTSGYQHFEPEWVVDGEGWLGNTGSNKAILGFANLPLSYIDPISTIMTQPKGVHSLKIRDDLSNFGGNNNPYFSLTDFTNNRLIRGTNNDVSAFPILSSWNSYTGSRSDDEIELDNWFSDDTPMTDFISETENFITFENTALNQRDLWWRSIEGGTLGIKAKKELALGIFQDQDEKYRDFLLSYDYRIFGKSWLNPQENKVPLKSYSFYNDSEINNWISQRDDNYSFNSGIAGNYENQLYGDYTYGLFINSDISIENSLEFYSIGLRDFLSYIYNIGLFYGTITYTSIYDLFLIFSEFIWNYFIFKNEIIRIFIKFLILSNINIITIQYILYPILDLINLLNILVYELNLILASITITVLTIHDMNLINNTIYFEFIENIINKLYLNKYLNSTIVIEIKYTLFYFYITLLIYLFLINIIFFLILILI